MIKYKYTDFVEENIYNGYIELNVNGLYEPTTEPSENFYYSIETTYIPTIYNTNKNNFKKNESNIIFIIGWSIGLLLFIFLLIIYNYKKK